MQTFLPYSDFRESAKSLDMKRLGKQRVEAYQILRSLLGISTGWRNHPATKMWRGHELSLYDYTLAICDEWVFRGYRDTLTEKVYEYLRLIPAGTTVPPWLGDPNFHRAHRANLVAKDPLHYTPQFGALPFEPYIWPVQ